MPAIIDDLRSKALQLPWEDRLALARDLLTIGDEDLTEEEANDIINALNAGESFAELAKSVSTDTGSGAKGGELGWQPATTYVKEFQIES